MYLILMEMFTTSFGNHVVYQWYQDVIILLSIWCTVMLTGMILAVLVERWWAAVDEHQIGNKDMTVSRWISLKGLQLIFPSWASDSLNMINSSFFVAGVMFVIFGTIFWPVLLILYMWHGSILLSRFTRRTQKRVNHLTEHNK